MMAKPSPSGVPLEELRRLSEELADYAPIYELVAGTITFEKLLELGAIEFLELAFIEIETYTRALDKGNVSIEEFNHYKAVGGGENALVPISYLRAIGEAWRKYLAAPPGTSLGEAFGLEGRGQGRQKSRDKVQNVVRGVLMARAVLGYRAHQERIGQPISINKACAQVASHIKIGDVEYSADAFEAAYDKFHPIILDEMRGGVIGGETS